MSSRSFRSNQRTMMNASNNSSYRSSSNYPSIQNQHQHNSTNSEQYMCEVCSKLFESSQQLVLHSIQHPQLIAQYPELRGLVSASIDTVPQNSNYNQFNTQISNCNQVNTQNSNCNHVNTQNSNHNYVNTQNSSYNQYNNTQYSNYNQVNAQELNKNHTEHYKDSNSSNHYDSFQQQRSNYGEYEVKSYNFKQSRNNAVQSSSKVKAEDCSEDSFQRETPTSQSSIKVKVEECSEESLQCESPVFQSLYSSNKRSKHHIVHHNEYNSSNGNESFSQKRSYREEYNDQDGAYVHDCIDVKVEDYKETYEYMNEPNSDEPFNSSYGSNIPPDGQPLRKKSRFDPVSDVTTQNLNTSGDEAVKCEICNIVFQNMKFLEKHAVIHTNKRPLECVQCHKCFSSSDALKQHKWVHEKKRVVRCKHCVKTFISEGDLQQHIRALHQPREEAKNKISNGDSMLNSNSSKQSEGYSTASEEVNKQLETDESNKELKCPKCNKMFTVKKHLFTKYCKACSTGNKGHDCKKCNRHFINLASLQQHMKLHKKKAQFVCDICEKPFTMEKSLQQHMNSQHSKDNNLGCDICGEVFVRRRQLRYHWNEKHADILMKCGVDGCKYEFLNKDDFMKHKATHVT